MQRVLNFMRNPKLAHIFLFFKSWSCLFLICIWSCSLYGHVPYMVMTPSFPYMVMFQLVKKEQEYQDLEGKHTQTMFDYQAKVSKFEEEKKQLVVEV